MILAAALALVAAPASIAASPIRSIDIADRDYSDLEPVARDIGDARVVMLGEQTHGDGSAFLAKSRLVRFLHERHGFDVLVFESGFTDLATAQARIDDGEAPSVALKQAVFPVWSASDQFAPLLAYLDADRQSKAPLRFAGIDAQFTGKTVEALPAEWRAVAAKLPESEGRAALLRLAALMEEYAKVRLGGLKDPRLTDIKRYADAARKAIMGSSISDRARRAQQLKSTGNFFAFALRMKEGTPEVFNLRDEQMADNLRFLMAAHPDKKFIVWGATSHFIRSRDVLTDAPAKEMKSVGTLLSGELGSKLYVLATSGGSGEIGSWAKRVSTPLPAITETSLEAGLAKQAPAFSFVPRAGLGGRQTIGVLGYQPVEGAWDKAIDGLLFIKTMKPTSYAEPPVAKGAN